MLLAPCLPSLLISNSIVFKCGWLVNSNTCKELGKYNFSIIESLGKVILVNLEPSASSSFKRGHFSKLISTKPVHLAIFIFCKYN